MTYNTTNKFQLTLGREIFEHIFMIQSDLLIINFNVYLYKNLPNRAPEACPSFLTVPVLRSKTLPLPPLFGLPSCGCKFNCSRTFSTSSG